MVRPTVVPPAYSLLHTSIDLANDTDTTLADPRGANPPPRLCTIRTADAAPKSRTGARRHCLAGPDGADRGVQRAHLRRGGAAGPALARPAGRLADPLWPDLRGELSAADRLLDAAVGGWLRVRLPGRVADRRGRVARRVCGRVRRLALRPPRLRRAAHAARPALHRASPHHQARRAQAAGDDPAVPAAVQPQQRGAEHDPDGDARALRPRHGAGVAEAAGARVRGRAAGAAGGARRRDGRAHQGRVVPEHRPRRPTRRRHRLPHLAPDREAGA